VPLRGQSMCPPLFAAANPLIKINQKIRYFENPFQRVFIPIARHSCAGGGTADIPDPLVKPHQRVFLP
jgi:hypothetical protein